MILKINTYFRPSTDFLKIIIMTLINSLLIKYNKYIIEWNCLQMENFVNFIYKSITLKSKYILVKMNVLYLNPSFYYLISKNAGTKRNSHFYSTLSV